MLNPTQTRVHIPNNPEILGGGIAAVGMGAVLSLDRLQGSRAVREFRSYPDFYTADNNAAETLGLLPGCQTDGELEFDQLRSGSFNQNLVVADYPEKNFDIKQVCRGLGDAFLRLEARKPNIICKSTGGIVVRHFLEYAQESGLAEQLDGFGSIVLDDAIHDASDVRLAYRALVKGATLTRNSWVVDRLKPQIMSHIAGKDSFSNRAHVETVASEGAFINRTDHPDGDYSHLVESVYFIHGPAGDRVAKTTDAVRKFHANFPGKLVEVVDTDRAPLSHTGGKHELPLLLQYATNRPIIPELTGL